jgi:hypothetical protein
MMKGRYEGEKRRHIMNRGTDGGGAQMDGVTEC